MTAAALLAVAVFAVAGTVFYFGTGVGAAKANRPDSGQLTAHQIANQTPGSQSADAQRSLSSKLLSLPMFFEPNQGQTDPQVKFIARGAGYGMFLTADEAVLELQRPVPSTRTATALPKITASAIRMKLEGANTSAHVSGSSPLGGKSNYFLGNDRSKWRTGIPQFARVEYQSVYPGVNLVYYGNQGQFEYDFHVAPGADPHQIALSFNGATVRVDSGDLVLSTPNGDVRFHAPRVYQPAKPGDATTNAEQTVAGSFRQLADNKIGFAIGDYDHSRELVIDPVLTYSTYLGAGGESLVKVAIDAADNIYLAGSTTSAYFFPNPVNGHSPLQGQLNGVQNLFIAEINPTPEPNQPMLLYATYLGGSGTDSLAGIAVDSSFNIYVAGTTNSPNFPTTSNAFQTAADVAGDFPGTHGFLSAITLGLNFDYSLTYSTYLAGNGVDTVTGMAIDSSCLTQSGVAACNAYLTGVTTSTNPVSNGFPANANGYQIQSNAPIAANAPGNPQFFASKIYTSGSGGQSMLYSTFFGGGNFGSTDIAIGGGIAVDPTSANVNMYFTGATNQLGVANGTEAPFPLFAAQQTCLNQASQTTNCTNNTSATDAFIAKIDPNESGSDPVYSTYLGAESDDYSYAVAVDSSTNAYVVGKTSSTQWQCNGCPTGFQTVNNGVGASNGYIVKVGPIGTGSVYPLTYFTYLGGTGPDSIQDIKVDSQSAVHVVGSTFSPPPSFPITANLNGVPSEYGGEGDAFVALISTTLSGTYSNGSAPPGDFSSYLGGSELDQGSGVAIDVFGATYVAGTTQSPQCAAPCNSFPITSTALQSNLNTADGPQNAFVSKVGSSSQLAVTYPNTSPSPNPVAAGTQITFTFNVTNNGPDNANLVAFNGVGLPTTGLTTTPTASVTQGTGGCNPVQGSTVSCSIPYLAVNSTASVEINMTPAIPVLDFQIPGVAGTASANAGAVTGSVTQPTANVVDFEIPPPVVVTPIVSAGDTAVIQVSFCPETSYGYNATITPTQTTAPSMVTATTPTFNPTTVTLAGTACGTTTLSIATVARPVNSAGLRHRPWFYASWLPIGGLSLAGFGLAAGRKRRWWLAGLLCLVAGLIMLLPSCGSSSTSVTSGTGTQAGTYTITITGSAGTSASHQTQVLLQVD